MSIYDATKIKTLSNNLNIYEDGTVLNIRRYQITMNCVFDISQLPADDSTCPLMIYSRIWPQNILKLVPTVIERGVPQE